MLINTIKPTFVDLDETQTVEIGQGFAERFINLELEYLVDDGIENLGDAMADLVFDVQKFINSEREGIRLHTIPHAAGNLDLTCVKMNGKCTVTISGIDGEIIVKGACPFHELREIIYTALATQIYEYATINQRAAFDDALRAERLAEARECQQLAAVGL